MKVTKRAVDRLAAGVFIWERGFGVKGNADGSASYLLSYRVGRRKRRYTIGTHGSPWTPDAARKEATRLLALVASGVDPMAMKSAVRAAPTVRELVERFLREHVDAKRKLTTAKRYRGILEKLVIPVLGNRAVTDVTRADIAALHHRLRETPVTANRMVLVVSKMMNLAERWGLRPDGTNPARHVERYREQARERYLDADELRRLGAALAMAETTPVLVPGEAEPRMLSPFALAAIKLLILTGARRGEILALKWQHVHVEQGVLFLPESKTGRKPVFLNAPARAVLEAVPRVEGNPYVIVGGRKARGLVNITETWYAVRALGGLKDVRLHDLRHSLASVGAGAGLSLPVIGGLLGHTQAQTTKRYAHLAAEPLRAAAELVGEKISAAMRGAS
jgi:integrase